MLSKLKINNVPLNRVPAKVHLPHYFCHLQPPFYQKKGYRSKGKVERIDIDRPFAEGHDNGICWLLIS